MHPPRTDRHPIAIWAICFLFLAGVAQLISGTEPGSVEALVPKWLSLSWSVILTAGSGLVLIGTVMPNRLAGLQAEVYGCVLLAPASLAYAVALAKYNLAGSGVALALLLGLAAGCSWRVYQIARYIRSVRAELRAMGESSGQ